MNESKLMTICATIVIMCSVVAFGYYHVQRDRLMSANIENGIVKGIDPVAIKCAYDSHSTMCAVYAGRK
jgi:hypothetical protein